MGSIVDSPSPACFNSHKVSTFHIAGLVSDQVTTNRTPTGMREDLLLLSWLVVLLRTREDTEFSFEWTYSSCGAGAMNEPKDVMRVAVNEVVTDLDSRAREVAATISRHIASRPPIASSDNVSLILSTGHLSRFSDKTTQDGPLLHLEARFTDDHIDIFPVWQSEAMLPFTVTRHIETLVDTVKLCISNPDQSIQSLLAPTTHDLDRIWGWNHQLPPTCDFCMHDVISEQAQRHPDKAAIDSWDGELTYGQIDRYSTLLARSLRVELGVQLHDFVPVCFEKSRWTIIAVLAVMKAGATMVLMDPTLPLARLQNMATQVGSKAMLTSRAQHDFSRSILPDGRHIVVEEATFEIPPDTTAEATEPLPTVPPSALMYIIFTSGSTGTPKGVKISHQTYSSSAIPRARAVGYTEDSRVLDFASYAFDVSIDSMLLTLANGGCLCIPSDEDRLNDINGAMRRMRVNYAGITPSVARILELDVIASLSGLGLGGEAASARDVNLWGQHTRIIIGYGPCECTIGCTVNSSAAKGRDYISIGPGNGAAIWITDPNDHETLVPVGAVGELLVEGPIVGQGYLNDPDKTAAAFIEDPRWMTGGHGSYAGRQGRLYKTGDLGRYDPDGSGEIVFVGRKDTQVKLRGQRVELGEIESQLKARLPQDINVIAEVIVPLGSSRGQPTLVAFVSSHTQSSKHSDPQADLEFAPQLHDELRKALSKANEEVAEVLPRYMVPTAYIPVNRIPTLISGKTDRKKLREFGAKVDLRQLTVDKPEDAAADGDTASDDWEHVDRPLTDIELRLRQAWALTLKLDSGAIRVTDNFFALGGDSLAAMRLVSVCRERGLDLSVTSTFGKPTLSAMAAVAAELRDGGSGSVPHVERPPFSLINESFVESAIAEAAKSCETEPDKIEDLYPCTPTQESLFTFSLKSVEAYIAQRVACIPSHISVDAWKHAWGLVVAANPILRTRLVQLPGHSGLGQAVLKEDIEWSYSAAELTQYLDGDRDAKMELGQSLARYAIVEPPQSGKRYMVWTLHHAVYDGWSEPLVLEMVYNALGRSGDHVESSQGHVVRSGTASMGDLVKFVRDTDEIAMQDFWRRELQGAVGPQYPRVPSRDFLPTPDGLLERQIPLNLSSKTAGFPFTLATLIRGAWALVASQFSGNDDVVFGETLTGRDIPLPGVEGILGPLVATVPVRVRIDREGTVASYLQTVQQAMSDRIPYQHMGMQNIRKVSRDAQYACEAPSGLVIQPDAEHSASHKLGFEHGDVVREAIHFNPYSLMIACGIQKGGFRVCASFDSSLVEPAQMERILAQLETACVELAKDLSRSLNKISCLPAAELDRIWSWNRHPPSLGLESPSRTLRTNAVVVKPGSSYHPQATVPWVCDLRNPSMLSPIGCSGELWLEGAFWASETIIESPAWLMAGSIHHPGRTGKVQPTGDIVRLQEDGNLVFVGRKDKDTSAQGGSADLVDLEVHFKTYLPSIRAAAVVLQAAAGNPGQEVIRMVLMEQPASSSQSHHLSVMSENHNIVTPSGASTFETTICGTIPADLAGAVKRLDKFAQNSLAAHLVPSAYVVVDRLPSNGNEVDRDLLIDVASKIPQSILAQLRRGFEEVWRKGLPGQTTTTAAESILRSSWEKILGLDPEQIDVDDNFFRLGGDSVLAMKLVSHLRAQGHGLTVADIFRHMRLADAAKVLKMNQYGTATTRAVPTPPRYQPFSMLGSVDAHRFVAEIIHPRLADACWSIQDVYPVTDSQALDVRATIDPPRTSVQYTMLYFAEEAGIDRAELARACHRLVQSHDILRTVFVEHESTLFQVVLEKLDIPVTTHLAENEDLEQSVKNLCAAQAESGDFRLGSPFVQMFIVEGKGGQHCLVLGLSHAQYDGVSLPRLLQDLEALYSGKKRTSSVPLSSYLAQSRDERTQKKALQYWGNLLDGSSLSILDEQIRSAQPTEARATFRTNPVQGVSQLSQGITTASLLTAAWALVLARRLQKSDVTFGNITSGRNMDWMPNAESVMGPCYQFTPVRIRFQPEWTAEDLLHHVQRQSAETLAHDFVGFNAISKHCSSLSSPNAQARFFDSIVHHQDWDDVDSMPFAGGSCKVDIMNPHGDAAYPLKAVSFVRDGEVHVGVVGSETDVTFVDSLLDNLTAVVKELASSGAIGALLEKEIFSQVAVSEK